MEILLIRRSFYNGIIEVSKGTPPEEIAGDYLFLYCGVLLMLRPYHVDYLHLQN